MPRKNAPLLTRWSPTTPSGAIAVAPTAAIGQPFGYLDTSGDNSISPGDALDVINAINASQGSEGEQDSGAGGQESGVERQASSVATVCLRCWHPTLSTQLPPPLAARGANP